MDEGKKKRNTANILKEFVSSEKRFIESLKKVAKDYNTKMDDKACVKLMPGILVGQKKVLLENVAEVYKLHSRKILPGLKACIDNPLMMGRCFENWKKDLEAVYVPYCINLFTASELVKAGNTFFRKCQRDLGHPLDLYSYLLEPVQRMPRYVLLLTDLLKNSKQDNVSGLTRAVKRMHDVVLKMDSATINGPIKEYSFRRLRKNGKLMLANRFHVRKNSNKELFLQQVLLYEKRILICQEIGSLKYKLACTDYLKISEIDKLKLNTSDTSLKIGTSIVRVGRLQCGSTTYTLLARVEVLNQWNRELQRLLRGHRMNTRRALGKAFSC